MTLKDIFKTNPELLENSEVKQLIEYCSEKHISNYKMLKKYLEFYDKILEICVYSNIILKEGKSEKESLKLILEQLENF